MGNLQVPGPCSVQCLCVSVLLVSQCRSMDDDEDITGISVLLYWSLGGGLTRHHLSS